MNKHEKQALKDGCAEIRGTILAVLTFFLLGLILAALGVIENSDLLWSK